MINSVWSIPLAPEIDFHERKGTLPAGERFSSRFFIGPENQLLKVALRATTRDCAHYSPVLLYGPSGVGKSHFVLGVAARYRAAHREHKSLVTTGADFARAFASAIELDSLDELRLKLRQLDLLVLDGLEELASKLPAQLELLYTIDALLAGERYIFVTARSAVAEMRTLHAGLRSRLSAGLAVPMRMPSSATCQAFIGEFAKQHAWPVSQSLHAALGCPTEANLPQTRTLRELRGVLFQLMNQPATPQGRPWSNEEIRALLSTQVDRKPTLRDITKHVARYFHFHPSDLAAPSRRRGIVRARSVAIYLSRNLIGASYQELGDHFGNRDHTTALHAFRSIASSIETDLDIQQAVSTLTRQLTSNFQTMGTNPKKNIKVQKAIRGKTVDKRQPASRQGIRGNSRQR